MLTDAEVVEMRTLAAETYTATVTVTTGAGGGWDPADGPTGNGDTNVLYGPAKPARVQAIRNTAQPGEAAGQHVTVRPYKIALPWDTDAADIPVNALLTVDSHPRDHLVVGKTLTVTGTVYGDLAIERVVYANLDLTNQPGA